MPYESVFFVQFYTHVYLTTYGLTAACTSTFKSYNLEVKLGNNFIDKCNKSS